ncbi:TFIIB-type zinc ribbon-containing protein [Candidatus Woesearchaeota archaeon]|nr:TFIIB-type zinc ribbon-containing protein [Candidatus Woesearchaeota archaeon]
MKCPDCGSEEIIRSSGEIFCKKCGLEIDELDFFRGKRGSRKDLDLKRHTSELLFVKEPKQELYALKLGLKNNKLTKDWTQLLGFKLNNGYLKSELKGKALLLIKKAYEKHKLILDNSEIRMQNNWSKIHARYFAGIETLLNFKWQSHLYTCYLSLVCNGGIHNSSKNFIIIQSRLDKISNYVIARELFHIIFRNYTTRFFKERYDDFDNNLSEVLVNFVLLTYPGIRTLFSDIKFSLDYYKKENHKQLAVKLWPLWKQQKPFKEFMIDSCRLLGKDKTLSN